MDSSATRMDNVAALRIQGEMNALSASDTPLPVDALVAERRIVAVLSNSELIRRLDLGVGAVVFLYKKAPEGGGGMTVQGLCNQPLAIVNLLCMEHESAGLRQSRHAARGYLHLAAKTGQTAALPGAPVARPLMNA